MQKYHQYKRQSEGLSIRAKTRLNLIIIIVVAIFFGLVALPYKQANFPAASFFSKFYPHLGLDLQGGTHLVYEADLSSVSLSDKNSALEGARDVIERRVNALGVAEPVVQIARKGAASRVVIELAGVQDVNQAIKMIGETPLLEFKELGNTQSATATSSEEISRIEQANQQKQKLAEDLIKRIQQGESFEELSKQYSDDEAVKNNGGDLGWVTRGKFVEAFDNVIFDELKVGELRSTPSQTQFGYHIIKKTGERTNAQGEKEVQSSHILLKTESVAS